MSIKKQYLKNNGICKLTFSLKENHQKLETVKVIGDFNNWDLNCEPMKKLKNNEFSQTINLESGKAYQFRYLINDSIWENEPEASQLIPNGIASDEYNSVVIL